MLYSIHNVGDVRENSKPASCCESALWSMRDEVALAQTLNETLAMVVYYFYYIHPGEFTKLRANMCVSPETGIHKLPCLAAPPRIEGGG
jgi:hypothetical protein